MGGVVSSGLDNDDLINNLLEADYIKTPIIERVFRAVDRAEYFLPESRANAYKDLAWKYGNLHLSAPCIYSEAMEGLCLKPGLSFLNMGSGTGYLSTMVGLILGSQGVNHGIEFHSDVIQYANKKLEDFKKHSGALDEFDFCEPKFIHGNCLCLPSECIAQYDRIYCGASCPEQYQNYMKNLIKVGGILVMPINDELIQFRRISATNYERLGLLPVSFASMIQPIADAGHHTDLVQLPDIEPPSLQALCRTNIRNILRKNIERKNVKLKKQFFNGYKRKRTGFRRIVLPLFDSDDSSEENRHIRIVSRNREENDGFLNFVVERFREQVHGAPPESANASSRENNTETEQSSDDRMETDTTESADEPGHKSKCNIKTHVVIEHSPSMRPTTSSQSENEENEKTDEKPQTSANAPASNDNSDAQLQTRNLRDSFGFVEEIHSVFVDVQNLIRAEGFARELDINDQQEERADNNTDQSNRQPTQDEEEKAVENESSAGSRPTTSDDVCKKKREKFDSGLGDEIVENQSESSDDDIGEELQSSSGDDSGQKRHRTQRSLSQNTASKWRRIDTDIQTMVTDSSSENEPEEENHVDNEMKMYKSAYTSDMRLQIQELPLPKILKNYLDFYRDFF